jgi:hypothetical protein
MESSILATFFIERLKVDTSWGCFSASCCSNSDTGTLSWQSYRDEMMRKLHVHLSPFVEDGKFTTPDAIGNVIGGTFAEFHDFGPASLDAEKVPYRWLAVVRTVALPIGENQVSADPWKSCCWKSQGGVGKERRFHRCHDGTNYSESSWFGPCDHADTTRLTTLLGK